MLLELRVDEEGREDDAEEQEDAAQDGAHVRDLVGRRTDSDSQMNHLT